MVLSCSIPQDVVDIIISHLGDDNDALKQCSLISHSCLAAGRRHLFSTVSLYSARRCQHLNNLLTTNPYLTTYTRHLCLDGQQKPFDPRRSRCWVSEPTLPVVLNMIAPRLNSLALHYIYWKELSSELQHTMLDILHTPGVFNVNLVSVHSFPTNLLTHLSHLRRLSLLSLSGTSGNVAQATVLEPLLKRRPLHGLEFDQRATSVKSILELERVWDMSQLRELSITGSSAGILDVASSLLTTASKYLEFFAWHFQYPYRIVSKPNEPASQTLDMSCLSGLRFLHLKSALHEGLGHLLPWLAHALCAPALRTSLERVIIVLECERKHWDSACIQRICRSSAWSDLDAALAAAPKAKLRIVLRGTPVVVGCRVGNSIATFRSCEVVAERMPLLWGARALQVEVDVRPVGATWEGLKEMSR